MRFYMSIHNKKQSGPQKVLKLGKSNLSKKIKYLQHYAEECEKVSAPILLLHELRG